MDPLDTAVLLNLLLSAIDERANRFMERRDQAASEPAARGQNED